jgi:thiamine biosynthesis lipoprotein
MIPMIPLALPSSSTAGALEIEHQQDSSTQSRFWRFHDEYVLGTRLEVLVNSHSEVLANEAANAARREIERLNQVFNHRRSESEVSALNRSRLANASADLFAVVQLSETWRDITRGAFDGRMGALLRLWDADSAPDRLSIDDALAAVRDAKVALDPVERQIELSSTAVLSLDAVAKGYIVDAALTAARRAVPAIEGLAIGIGGDIRCWGESPDRRGWRIGIPDPATPAENAPLVDAVFLKNAAIATSGRGPRDYMGNRCRSTTISPFTGRPVHAVISASVVASHAADADAIATACLVLRPEESLALVGRLDRVAARITEAHGRVHESTEWPTLQLAATAPEEHISSTDAKAPSFPPELRWPRDWELGINYIAPDRKDSNSADFRTPYMAVWITDAQNKPVRTVLMVGRDPDWQRDNFIWWGSHRARAERLVELRSQATTLSGRYPMFWFGVDDDWKSVPIGKYTLHLETSQERGKHSYRSMPLELGRERFKTQLPILPDSGGIEITYGHYNDRYKPSE